MNYFRSDQVQVFPCAYRGAGFDLYSRLNAEYNFTHLYPIDKNNESYVIDYSTEDKWIHLIIKGYYFEITGFDVSAFPDRTLNFYINIQNGDSNENKSAVLTNWDNSSTELDVKDTSASYSEFRGLGYTNDNGPAEDASYSIYIDENREISSQYFYNKIDPKNSNMLLSQDNGALKWIKYSVSENDTIVKRDINGNFSANKITASALQITQPDNSMFDIRLNDGYGQSSFTYGSINSTTLATRITTSTTKISATAQGNVTKDAASGSTHQDTTTIEQLADSIELKCIDAKSAGTHYSSIKLSKDQDGNDLKLRSLNNLVLDSNNYITIIGAINLSTKLGQTQQINVPNGLETSFSNTEVVKNKFSLTQDNSTTLATLENISSIDSTTTNYGIRLFADSSTSGLKTYIDDNWQTILEVDNANRLLETGYQYAIDTKQPIRIGYNHSGPSALKNNNKLEIYSWKGDPPNSMLVSSIDNNGMIYCNGLKLSTEWQTYVWEDDDEQNFSKFYPGHTYEFLFQVRSMSTSWMNQIINIPEKSFLQQMRTPIFTLWDIREGAWGTGHESEYCYMALEPENNYTYYALAGACCYESLYDSRITIYYRELN